MTNEEAIKDFEAQNRLLLGIRTTSSQETYERNLTAIKALETLQHIDTVINGTLEVQGFPISMVQEDVFRYKAIINIMKDFDEWQKSEDKK